MSMYTFSAGPLSFIVGQDDIDNHRKELEIGLDKDSFISYTDEMVAVNLANNYFLNDLIAEEIVDRRGIWHQVGDFDEDYEWLEFSEEEA